MQDCTKTEYSLLENGTNKCVKECPAGKYRHGNICSTLKCSQEQPPKISLNNVCVDICDNFIKDSGTELVCEEKCSGHGWEWSYSINSDKFKKL